MRDRLIELIRSAPRTNTVYGDIKLSEPVQTLQTIADHLIENGVIVPPCKVGSEVYFSDHDNKSAWAGNVVSFSLDAAHLWFNCQYKCGLNMWHPIEDFGKSVFLTREEAEKALAERREG